MTHKKNCHICGCLLYNKEVIQPFYYESEGVYTCFDCKHKTTRRKTMMEKLIEIIDDISDWIHRPDCRYKSMGRFGFVMLTAFILIVLLSVVGVSVVLSSITWAFTEHTWPAIGISAPLAIAWLVWIFIPEKDNDNRS